MKYIERRSEVQRSRADKRMKKGGYRPYSNALEVGEYLGVKIETRFPFKFNPPISADWKRW